jgi:hypothetical protein
MIENNLGNVKRIITKEIVMQESTVTISLEEFDRLRNCEKVLLDKKSTILYVSRDWCDRYVYDAKTKDEAILDLIKMVDSFRVKSGTTLKNTNETFQKMWYGWKKV